ncbi:endocuticle structural glycoprotein SgAbd-5 [Drosophila grimshawi]|uniref:GH15655 n=1 Tax=Drosophila grimshawi TaxID=7222 RepID=B4IZT1_DROGR|nr:endocuticle structural glycoprotein SgAbd-5 [Drosophila grimshawi]EDV95666.1 GH15655 [Drosophila grimshawi]
MHRYTLLFVVVCLVGSVVCQGDQQAQTLRSESDNNGVDKYSFAYETSNGITRNEEGVLQPGTGEESGVLHVQGSTTWTAPDGKKYEITFTADETGYHPTFKQL